MESSQNVLAILSSGIPNFVTQLIIANFQTDMGCMNSRIERLIDALQDVSNHAILYYSILISH
jgi:hypothetical protein